MNAQADNNTYRIGRAEFKRLQALDHEVGALRVENQALKAQAAEHTALIEKLRTAVADFTSNFMNMLPAPEKGMAIDEGRR